MYRQFRGSSFAKTFMYVFIFHGDVCEFRELWASCCRRVTWVNGELDNVMERQCSVSEYVLCLARRFGGYECGAKEILKCPGIYSIQTSMITKHFAYEASRSAPF